MAMLVDETHIVEESPGPDSDAKEEESAIRLQRNNLKPEVIVDGVDVVLVVENQDDTYQIDYWGYTSGCMRVEPEGVEQLGKTLLGDTNTVPRWIIDPETIDSGSLPWWVPDETEAKPAATCELCHTDTLARYVFTPNKEISGGDVEIVCQGCWNRRVPYMYSETATKDAISHDTEIDIDVKIESLVELDTGGELYTVRDLAGNAFDLKIWASEVDVFDLEIGQWYSFQNAVGDTYDDPMIESNYGKLSVEPIESFDATDLLHRGTQKTKNDIEDERELDIVAEIDRINTFDNGDTRCVVTDRNGNEFDLKIWAAEASQYDLTTDQWYYFVRADGNTYNEPMIESNNGAMVDIPVENVDQRASV